MGLSEDDLFDLRTAAFDLIMKQGLPTDQEARDWLVSLRDENITPEEAFMPLYDAYFAGSGQFPLEYWEQITTEVGKPDLWITDDGDLGFNFNFEFDTGDGDLSPGSGSRTASGTI